MNAPHHSPASNAARFFLCAGSPLNGKPKPMDWDKLNCFRAKADALRGAGLAGTWEEACSLLGRHAGAVKAERKRLAAERKTVKAKTAGKGPWWDK